MADNEIPVRASLLSHSGQLKVGRGTLRITDGAAVFVPTEITTGRTGSGEISDHGPITLITARFAPPWANTFLMLTDGTATVRIRMSGSEAPALRDALKAAGLTIREETTKGVPPFPGR